MSDESKHNVEELLSGYVDGELSKRKYTELKRLMEHDPTLVERFEELKKQKQFLNSMPVESAPEGLLNAVMATQERKYILNEYSAASVESEGVKNLMLRRLATAAVILVLFGGLAGIIIKIVAPVGSEPFGPVVNNDVDPDIELVEVDPGAVEKVLVADTDLPVFRAELHLKTEQAIAMNGFIKNAIFKHNLNNSVNPPENEGSSSTVRLACGIDSVVALLDDIQAEWDKCKEVDLSVYDHALAKMIVIKHVSPNQLMGVFTEDKFYTRMQLAKDFEAFNLMNPHGGRRIAKSPADPVKPNLTSSNADIKDRIDGGEKISLVITVTGI